MHRTTQQGARPNDAAQALQRLQRQATTLEHHRAALRLAQAEGWLLWPLGGFQFTYGSVLRRLDSRWQCLDADQARAEQQQRAHDPLDVRLLHTYEGRDGREKCSVSEARFDYDMPTGNWRLTVEYEAYMDSPLFGFETGSVGALLDLELLNLLLDTPLPSGRARLQQIALSPGWLELLCVSRRPEEVAMDSS